MYIIIHKMSSLSALSDSFNNAVYNSNLNKKWWEKSNDLQFCTTTKFHTGSCSRAIDLAGANIYWVAYGGGGDSTAMLGMLPMSSYFGGSSSYMQNSNRNIQ